MRIGLTGELRDDAQIRVPANTPHDGRHQILLEEK
jgi:hypothetical protein